MVIELPSLPDQSDFNASLDRFCPDSLPDNSIEVVRQRTWRWETLSDDTDLYYH